MKYIWTEDTGAGFHFWELVNKYLFQDEFAVLRKQSGCSGCGQAAGAEGG